jgi:hypothetical protein
MGLGNGGARDVIIGTALGRFFRAEPTAEPSPAPCCSLTTVFPE